MENLKREPRPEMTDDQIRQAHENLDASPERIRRARSCLQSAMSKGSPEPIVNALREDAREDGDLLIVMVFVLATTIKNTEDIIRWIIDEVGRMRLRRVIEILRRPNGDDDVANAIDPNHQYLHPGLDTMLVYCREHEITRKYRRLITGDPASVARFLVNHCTGRVILQAGEKLSEQLYGKGPKKASRQAKEDLIAYVEAEPPYPATSAAYRGREAANRLSGWIRWRDQVHVVRSEDDARARLHLDLTKEKAHA